MKVNRKSVSVKGYKRKHEIAVEETTIAGHVMITVLKNNNPIIKCTPKEYIKLKRLFCD
tara:strand:- start:344 stop:520 length:177 start_codon:yes stop_codon:yes gene_type:complete